MTGCWLSIRGAGQAECCASDQVLDNINPTGCRAARTLRRTSSDWLRHSQRNESYQRQRRSVVGTVDFVAPHGIVFLCKLRIIYFLCVKTMGDQLR